MLQGSVKCSIEELREWSKVWLKFEGILNATEPVFLSNPLFVRQGNTDYQKLIKSFSFPVEFRSFTGKVCHILYKHFPVQNVKSAGGQSHFKRFGILCRYMFVERTYMRQLEILRHWNKAVGNVWLSMCLESQLTPFSTSNLVCIFSINRTPKHTQMKNACNR